MNPKLPDTLAPQPLSHARSLDAAFYVGEGMVARDREAVFARSWQLVGHETALANAGDHLVTDVGGIPVVVIRDTEGRLRAFHNVCRHRAGPLVQGAAGHCDGELVCAYHGWRYALDGRLRAATGFG